MKKIRVPVWRVALVLIAVVFISAHMAAGLSAKYATKIDASGSFSTAGFSGGSVSVEQSNAVTNVSEATSDGVHVFTTSCIVNFDACDVARRFTLTLSTPDTGISFACPAGNLYTVTDCNGSRAFANSDTGYGQALSSGKAYVGVADITSGAASYTWSEITVSGNGKSIVAVDGKQIGMSASSYKVAVVYFRELSATASGSASSSADIAFSLNCEQVD